ncbi:unnamed protein product [Dracunculus medinensis]|uniref:GCS light chain n=1 Tax=Dracunculus medinensis TaxID=318479 RepID=A0A0N4U388_DRAME|nr:unnamed protein product [Dracunculus medinensis]
MDSLKLKIAKLTKVHIDTGNIHRHKELFRRIFKDSVEELLAILEYELNYSKNNEKEFELKFENIIVLKHDSEYCQLANINKDDLKITLKVFMSEFDAKQVEESVELALKQLNIIESDSELRIWLEKVLPVWKQFEKLVSNRFVYALGVADLDIAQLKALYEAAEKVRPMIDHYNTEHCCTVPQELRDYAKEHDIQLLTHNDPHLEMLSEQVGKLVEPLFGEKSVLDLKWLARYSVWVRSRSVIGAKGYILQFMKETQ